MRYYHNVVCVPVGRSVGRVVVGSSWVEVLVRI